MNIQLQPEMAKFVEEQVKAGRYVSADDAVNAAVARICDEEMLLSEDPDDEDIAALERGIAQLDAGEGRPWEQVRAELRRKYALKK